MNEAPAYIFDLDPQRLGEHLQARGMAGYRAAQVLEWVYKKHVADPRLMSNIARADRDTLAAALRFGRSHVVRHQHATDGVQKLLLEWDPPEVGPPEVRAPETATAELGSPPIGIRGRPQTECVMIPTADRKTACVSSQVGCPVGCHFCASGLGGLEANLSSGQIVEQVWLLDQLPGVGRITNVVFMGMGEPLANFDAVVAAVRTLMADWALRISGRRITISTVGLPAQMRRLADLQLPVTLAISLHAPNDTIRRQLIPWAQYVSIAQLLEAGQYYFDRTGREVTLEYTLLHQVNDRIEHARELSRIARTLRANVNLIRYNEVSSLPFGRPRDEDVRRFEQALRRAGVNTHIRASRGRDIAAACGQLRHETVTLSASAADKSGGQVGTTDAHGCTRIHDRKLNHRDAEDTEKSLKQ